MPQDLHALLDRLLSEDVLVPLGIISALFFVVSLVAIPLILIRLPVHYFDEHYPRSWFRNHHPVLRVLLHVMKNVLGGIFLVAGVAMLVLPGQGILSILIGLSLLEFPGKRRFEAKLVGQPKVFQAINALRKRFDRAPLVVHAHPSGDTPRRVDPSSVREAESEK